MRSSAPTHNSKLTVIIPSLKRTKDLQRCLDALEVQSRPADEILVIGRSEDPETCQLASRLQSRMSALRLVVVTEPGLIAAINCGLDNAIGDILVFTDDDAEAQVDWLQRIEKAFEDPSVGAVGGRDWIQDASRPAVFQPKAVSRIGVLTWYGVLHGNHHCPLAGHTKRVMFLKGVNMAFRCSALGSYRIDTALQGKGAQVGTEIDLCSRVRQSGFTVVFDERILVKHFVGLRPEGEERNQLNGSLFNDICFNNQYLIAKHFGYGRALAYFCNHRLFGSRFMPGFLSGTKWFFKRDLDVWRRFLQLTGVGIAGFRAGMRARRSQSSKGEGIESQSNRILPANRRVASGQQESPATFQ